ncbi:MAG TPA: hypothetical protein DC034_12495 [Clostridium sp.]|jgi:2-dehydropantoate 2-reductase|uniref:ketopantoate reductase family protein n=1 Tax=uncultured Clostridium sp. TaxID=59620 RepID=UPI000E989CD3|nr:2-dehydropantoate 2-reductase N-terminal domain-containing protein [uncultured Clostridium sp.]HBC97599.1 hypothetical protein [Clostridium sp.]
MKILILGDGVIGSVYGNELTKAGYDVTHFIRKERSQDVILHGIPIRCIDGRDNNKRTEELYRPEVISELAKENVYDLFIISAKSDGLHNIIASFSKKLANETTVLIFQSLWIDANEIESWFNGNKVLYGFPHIMGGGRDEQGIYCTIFGSPDAPSMIGEKDGTISNALQSVEKAFSDASMNPKITKDILGWIYTHYAEAAGLLAGVMQTNDYINFSQDKTVVVQTLLAIREGLRICKARGIPVSKIKPQCYYFLPKIVMVPFMKKMYATESAKLMIKGHITHSLNEMKSMVNDMIASGEQYHVDTRQLSKMKKNVDQFSII